MQRVIFATVVATGVALAAAPSLAQQQQKFPSKPVRLVVPFSAGGQVDTVARMIGSKMSESWRQPVVIENRPGAAGVIGTGMVAKAAPDGHTLLVAGASFAISAALQPSLSYDPIKDFAGVIQIGIPTRALLVAPALGVKSVRELISLAQANPGKIIFGSAQAGGIQHLLGERFRLAAGIKVINVSFKGGPETVIETLAGRIHYCMVNLGPSLPFIKDGKLLALAVLTPQRSPLLPDVPTMAESLPGVAHEPAYGLLAPAKTPRPVLNQISKEVARILNRPDVKERMLSMGFVAAPTTPEEYDEILRADIETFSKVARDAGLRSK